MVNEPWNLWMIYLISNNCYIKSDQAICGADVGGVGAVGGPNSTGLININLLWLMNS